jgi:hypothetical protein
VLCKLPVIEKEEKLALIETIFKAKEGRVKQKNMCNQHPHHKKCFDTWSRTQIAKQMVGVWKDQPLL